MRERPRPISKSMLLCHKINNSTPAGWLFELAHSDECMAKVWVPQRRTEGVLKRQKYSNTAINAAIVHSPFKVHTLTNIQTHT